MMFSVFIARNRGRYYVIKILDFFEFFGVFREMSLRQNKANKKGNMWALKNRALFSQKKYRKSKTENASIWS